MCENLCTNDIVCAAVRAYGNQTTAKAEPSEVPTLNTVRGGENES